MAKKTPVKKSKPDKPKPATPDMFKKKRRKLPVKRGGHEPWKSETE